MADALYSVILLRIGLPFLNLEDYNHDRTVSLSLELCRLNFRKEFHSARN